MKKIVVWLLISVTVISVFAGCQDNTTSGNISGETTTIAADGETAAEETTARLEADLPDNDYGGYKFRFLVREYDGNGYWGSKEVYAEEEIGDPINDAVYLRNRKIEEKYNIVISEVRSGNMLGDAQKVVRAGDHEYDCLMPHAGDAAALAQSQYLIDFNKLPYIDLSKPWWDQGSNNTLSIGGKYFFTMGELNIMDNDATYVMMFNKDVAANFGIDDLYDSVMNNEWTFDKLYSVIQTVSEDLDGNGVYDDNDRFGLLTDNGAIMLGMFYASGETLIKKDSQDYPVINTDLTRASAVMGKMLAIQSDKANTLLAENLTHISDPWTNGLNRLFKEGKGLFYAIGLTVMHKMRDMDSDFGLMPYPKFDESQEKYMNYVSSWCTNTVAIPVTTSDIDMASAIIEALAAESLYTLTPAYYEITIVNKTIRDEGSAEMLDIILTNRIYDLGGIYNWSGIGNLPMNTKDAGQFISGVSKIEAATQTAMDKTIDMIKEME